MSSPHGQDMSFRDLDPADSALANAYHLGVSAPTRQLPHRSTKTRSSFKYTDKPDNEFNDVDDEEYKDSRPTEKSEAESDTDEYKEEGEEHESEWEDVEATTTAKNKACQLVVAGSQIGKKTGNTSKTDVYTEIPASGTIYAVNGRVQGRKLVPWHRPRMVEKLLLHIQYECHRRGIQLPWDNIVHRLSPGSSGNCAHQHISKLRDILVAEGHLVPPLMGKMNVKQDPQVRGFVRDMDSEYLTETRIVEWTETYEDLKESLVVPGLVRGSGRYKQQIGGMGPDKLFKAPDGTRKNRLPIEAQKKIAKKQEIRKTDQAGTSRAAALRKFEYEGSYDALREKLLKKDDASTTSTALSELPIAPTKAMKRRQSSRRTAAINNYDEEEPGDSKAGQDDEDYAEGPPRRRARHMTPPALGVGFPSPPHSQYRPNGRAIVLHLPPSKLAQVANRSPVPSINTAVQYASMNNKFAEDLSSGAAVNSSSMVGDMAKYDDEFFQVSRPVYTNDYAQAAQVSQAAQTNLPVYGGPMFFNQPYDAYMGQQNNSFGASGFTTSAEYNVPFGNAPNGYQFFNDGANGYAASRIIDNNIAFNYFDPRNTTYDQNTMNPSFVKDFELLAGHQTGVKMAQPFSAADNQVTNFAGLQFGAELPALFNPYEGNDNADDKSPCEGDSYQY